MRELESQLLRLAVKAELLSRPLDLALAHEVIGVQRASAPRRRSAVTTRDVQHVIAHYFRARTNRLKPRPN
jgi:chromosomal replication initiation ATPase DnaA